MLDPEWNRAVAAVVGPDDIVRGTAFFVGSDLAVTCDHVLVAAGDGPVRLRAVASSLIEDVIGHVRDPDTDLALLRVASRPDRATIAFGPDVGVDRRVVSHGFGKDHSITEYPDGFPMLPVTISGSITTSYQGREVQVLVLGEANVTNGMSGAPVVDVETRSVVGVIRFSDRTSGEAKGRVKSNAMATPVAVVLRRWPRLRPPENEPPTFAGASLTDPPPEALARDAWRAFEPNAMHCVVIGSEAQATESRFDQLAHVMEGVLLNGTESERVWKSFLRARQRAELVGGVRREPPDTAVGDVNQVNLSVLDAFANPAALDIAIRLVVEADLALFDITGFEPGVMLLMGVRAASRRGLSIASHGGEWKDGERTGADADLMLRPFNLSDLALSSHTPTDGSAGEDGRVAPLAERISKGFDQLARHPFYRDLPVYDALRQLGSARDAWDTIPVDNEVLVLCSYAPKYLSTWRNVLSRQLSRVLVLEMRMMNTRVLRMRDIKTPQLVSQSLYERIRRCEACVADWSHSSPSTFFELGVRMAVSTWNVVQIANGEWTDRVADPADPDHLHQIGLMRDLFDPIVYRHGEEDVGQRIAGRLVGLKEEHLEESRGHRVRQVASVALGVVEERIPGLYEQLRDDADALSSADVNRDVPQALFYDVQDIKTDRERSALERRLAAWLYLEHRIGAGLLDRSDPRWVAWRELGRIVAKELYDAGDSDELADSIYESVERGEHR